MAGRIVVAGALHADRRLRVDRPPAPGETVVALDSELGTGGKGANQAIAAAAAGAPVRMVGAVGEDVEVALVLADLSARGVDASRIVRTPGVATGGATVLVDAAAENVIVVSRGANAAPRPTDVTAALHDLTDGDVVVQQNELPAPLTRAAAVGARTVWSAAPPPATRDEVVAAAVVLCNGQECRGLARLLGFTAEELPDAALAVARHLGATVVRTRGPHGALVVDGDRLVHVPAVAVAAVDTTGAGDVFAGWLAAALLEGHDVVEAARVAAVAGSLAVTRPGAVGADPTRDEVHALVGRVRQGVERTA